MNDSNDNHVSSDIDDGNGDNHSDKSGGCSSYDSSWVIKVVVAAAMIVVAVKILT